MTTETASNASLAITWVDPDEVDDALGYLAGYAPRHARLPNASLFEVSGALRNNGAYLVREEHGHDAWVVLYQGDDLVQALLTMSRHRLERDPVFGAKRVPGDVEAYAAGLARFIADQEATRGCCPNIQRLIEATKGCADLVQNGGKVAYEEACYNGDDVYGDANTAASLVGFAGGMAEYAVFLMEYAHVSTIEPYRQGISEVFMEAGTCPATPEQRIYAAKKGLEIKKRLDDMLDRGMRASATISAQDWHEVVSGLGDLIDAEVKSLIFYRFDTEEIHALHSPSDPRLDVAGVRDVLQSIIDEVLSHPPAIPTQDCTD